MRVLVIGASGMLGSRVVRRLLDEDDVEVLAGSRDPADRDDLAPGHARPVQVDLRDTDQVRAALAGVDVVLHAAHGLMPVRGNTADRVDRDGFATLVDEAQVAGVRRIVLSSVIGADPAHPVDFWRFKHVAEQRLANADLEHRSLRFAAFVEAHAIEMLGEPIRRNRRVPVIGAGNAMRSWVGADDAAAAAVDAIVGRGEVDDRPVTTVAGPRNATTNEVVDLLAAELGTRARVLRLPAAIPSAVATLTRPMLPSVARLAGTLAWLARDGDATDLSPRPDLVVTERGVDDLVQQWAATA